MKVPQDRNLCLMFVAFEKKSLSSFTKKGEALKPLHGFTLGVNGVQPNRGIVTTVVLHESTQPCLTSLEPAVELNSLLRARMVF